MQQRTDLLLIGGFLGAGKTSLLYAATKFLMAQGKKVGLITNDQAPELVDTALLLQTKAEVEELSGSCFCCNYEGFVDSIKHLKYDAVADIIIAEPVGSCADLSATLMQPLKAHYNQELKLLPLTVLADPFRLINLLDGRPTGLPASAEYIMRKQMEESDVMLITKKDLLAKNEFETLKNKAKQQYPDAKVLGISSNTGEGMQEWLDVIYSLPQCGQKVVELDYDAYAEGEALLGWLNASLNLSGKQVNWDLVANNIMQKLGKFIDAKKLGVGHLKIILKNGKHHVLANLTGPIQTLSLRGEAGVSNACQLVINARVGCSPEELEALVKEVLGQVIGKNITTEIKAWRCLSPGYPNPTHRFKAAV